MIQATIKKIGELQSQIETLSQFEKNFVQDNAARIEKWGDTTRFSEKQVALVDRIYQERVVLGIANGE